MAQDRWITGHEVVKQLGIMPFELAELLQNGLQAYTKTGKRLIAHDSYPPIILENIQDFLKNKGWPEDRITRQSPAIFNFYRRKGMRYIPDAENDDCDIARIESFALPKDDNTRKRKIAFYCELLFKQDDVKQFIIPVEKVQQQNEDADAHGKQPSLVKEGQTAEEEVSVLKYHDWLGGYTSAQLRSIAKTKKGKKKRALLCAADRVDGEKGIVLQEKYSISKRTLSDWMTIAREILVKDAD